MAQRGRPKKIQHPEIETVYQSMQPQSALYVKYLEKCAQESDINELLPYIFDIVAAIPDCRCVEFGVRIPTSTYAFLAAKPKRLVSYDIGRYPQVDEVEKLCLEEKKDFKFVLANVLEVEIEETDVLFSDCFHSKSFVEKELELHADKVRQYYIFHDTTSYWIHGEQPYNDETSPYGAGLGLKYAIEPFLESHPEWTVFARYEFNNGLLILKRN
jgi:hypothetical protein